jgi:hypothetical protein
VRGLLGTTRYGPGGDAKNTVTGQVNERSKRQLTIAQSPNDPEWEKDVSSTGSDLDVTVVILRVVVAIQSSDLY